MPFSHCYSQKIGRKKKRSPGVLLLTFEHTLVFILSPRQLVLPRIPAFHDNLTVLPYLQNTPCLRPVLYTHLICRGSQTLPFLLSFLMTQGKGKSARSRTLVNGFSSKRKTASSVTPVGSFSHLQETEGIACPWLVLPVSTICSKSCLNY